MVVALHVRRSLVTSSAALFASILIACSSGRSAEPAAPATIIPTTAPPTPPAPPTPEFPPLSFDKLTSGSRLRVWVYEDTPEADRTCLDLLPDMLPLNHRDEAPGKTLECVVYGNEPESMYLVEGRDGVVYLAWVMVGVVATAGFPTPAPISPQRQGSVLAFCTDGLPFLIPATRSISPDDPSVLFTSCRIIPPLRAHSGAEVKEVWLPVLSDAPRPVEGEVLPCWRLGVYQRIGRRDIRFVPCTISAD